MPLEPIFLMDLDVHGKSESVKDRLVAVGALSQNKIAGLPSALSDLASDIDSEESRALAAESALAADLLAEEQRALAAEGVLAGDISSEIAARISAVSGVQSNLDSVESSLQSAINAEQARALAAEAAIVASAGADVSAETTRALAAEGVLQNNIDGVAFDLTTAQAALSAALAAEQMSRIASDNVNRTIAEQYTDNAIANLVNSAPAMLDTLGEIATALQNEQSATTSILTSISSEVSRATAAEGLLDGRLDVLEAKQWRQALLTSNAAGVTSLSKPAGAPAIPNNAAEVMVFIDGRKVFFGSQFEVAADGGSISFNALVAGQTVEMLYFA